MRQDCNLNLCRDALKDVNNMYSYSINADKFLRGCLHDTGTGFILVRVHPGSYLSLCICLHDTGEKSHTCTSLVPVRDFTCKHPLTFSLSSPSSFGGFRHNDGNEDVRDLHV